MDAPAGRDPGSIRPRRAFLQPHHIYLILAALDVAMLILSLSIIQKMRVSYGDSVTTNAFWAQCLVQCVDLGNAAVDVNRPGNDAFLATPDANIELADQPAQLRIAREAFDRQLFDLREALLHRAGDEKVDELLAILAQVERPMAELVVEAEAIFQKLASRDGTGAGNHMATMDRRYARIPGDHALATLTE